MRGDAVMGKTMDYFVDKKVGGNAFAISVGHSMKYITKGKKRLFLLFYLAIS
jgi:hypothetical protein